MIKFLIICPVLLIILIAKISVGLFICFIGCFYVRKNMSSSRKFCVNDPNNFCYICGKYCQQLQRRNITDFVKQAYEEYFFQIYNRLNQSWRFKFMEEIWKKLEI
jgi:hypothetical protein